MYKITEKVALNPTVTKMVIEAPLIAKKAKPGQFIIVRPFEDSERIPLTVAGYDREKGTVDIIFQIVGGWDLLEPDLERKRLNFMIFQKHMETRCFLNIFLIYLNDLNELDLSGIMAVESPH